MNFFGTRRHQLRRTPYPSKCRSARGHKSTNATNTAQQPFISPHPTNAWTRCHTGPPRLLSTLLIPDPLSRCRSRSNAVSLTIRNWPNPAGSLLGHRSRPHGGTWEDLRFLKPAYKELGSSPSHSSQHSSNPFIWLSSSLVHAQTFPHTNSTILTRLHQTYTYVPNHNVGTKSLPYRGGRG